MGVGTPVIDCVFTDDNAPTQCIPFGYIDIQMLCGQINEYNGLGDCCGVYSMHNDNANGETCMYLVSLSYYYVVNPAR